MRSDAFYTSKLFYAITSFELSFCSSIRIIYFPRFTPNVSISYHTPRLSPSPALYFANRHIHTPLLYMLSYHNDLRAAAPSICTGYFSIILNSVVFYSTIVAALVVCHFVVIPTRIV